MDIRIADLNIIQDTLRTWEQVPSMIEFVLEGGTFKNMEIAKFPDGQMYVHNGHHRSVAISLAGREVIYEGEYYIKEWSYSDYNDIVFLNPDGSWRGYVTPLDITKETREADIESFKRQIKHIYDNQSPQHAIHFIKTRPDLYKKHKLFFTVEELAISYKETIESLHYVKT